MGALQIVLAIVWLVSGLGSAACVLAHSGDGVGVADVVGLRMNDNNASSGIIEKNLDRLTLICVGTFVVSLFLLGFLWPQAPIMQAIQPAS